MPAKEMEKTRKKKMTNNVRRAMKRAHTELA
jgi:hypothetical protein